MKSPKIIRILNKSAIAGLVVATLSFVIPLVPCKEDAGFKLCRLPNPFIITESTTKYYGTFTDSLAGATLQFIIPAIIFAIIFLLIRKKTANVLDLTNK